MKFRPSNFIQLTLACIVLILCISCNKDSDLLAEYVIENPQSIMVNDVVVTLANSPIVIEPLSNDAFEEPEKVTITQVTPPTMGTAEVQEDNTVVYTPNADETGTDEFDYTTSITNPDNSVSTETGKITVTVTEKNSSSDEYSIILSELKAFPSAFGAGELVSGGRGGKVYEVTNLNDSGEGSFRAALEATGDRIIIVKVEGLATLSSVMTTYAAGNGNLTIWGQFAPGRGLTVSGKRMAMYNCNNIIVRHMTFQNKVDTGFGSWSVNEIPDGPGVYFDHLSVRYGMDQIVNIGSRNSNNYSTLAYTMIAEGLDGHNTGSIFGDSGTGGADTGASTYARNMIYNVSHRIPNISGSSHLHENYNNYLVNWSSRIIRTNGGPHVDYFNNYAEKGNRPQASSKPVNKMGLPMDGFRTYTGWNYVEGQDETPNDNQTGLWVNYKANSEGSDGDPIDSSHYASGRQHNFTDPADGIWDVMDVPSKVMANVGHNRGINADGSPGFFRDTKDASYIDKTTKNTTESDFRAQGEWDNSKFTNTSLYESTSGDHIPDWFKNQHAHLTVGINQMNGVQVDWDFGTYTVKNTAGYTNLEMAAAYYAGDFEIMLY
ncbi:Ig-like domain-containing protein [Arenibacter sp. F26102]|uniref:Ig-like domain-containing protein n=1 Tax=Arenibacter sp. F26102 TaxID=2926416 RepID=UPI001FF0F669|nr:Ig-like domain-containing protein [Arenibacter sp. F26102]MCK0147043.1 Ig-like domain-containing protein [Arenibacter sp. F26102]